MLVIIKFTPVMSLRWSINMQPFGHDKSCSVSQFINGKSRNLQKSLNYLSEIATSTFDVDTPGCAG